jgi:ATP-dependent DNA helicase 2 subunit 2
VVSHRITHPESAELPPLNENIAEYVKPDKELFEAAQQEVSAFESAFKLEYNVDDENKKRQRVYWRDIIQREEAKTKEEAKNIEEEERIARLKGEGKDPFGKDDNEVKEISSVDPIRDFEKMTGDRKVDRLDEALPQMMSMIEKFVKNSLKGDLYGKAIDCIAAMRKVCIRDDEAGKYNDFMKKIKRVFSRGSYRDFFTLLQQAAKDGLALTLITQKESPISSNVT